MIEKINENLEAILCGVMLQQRSPCCDWLGPFVCVHLLHGETEFVVLKVNEHVRQYGRIPEHALCAKIHELFVNIISQGAVVELVVGFSSFE